ncbi:MAG: hypothetical protein OHK006_14750 [Thermodesulfovibrionales bacterium]
MPAGENRLRSIEQTVVDLKLLMEASALISSMLELDELIPVVMDKAKTLMQAEACSILLYNAETKKLSFDVALGADEEASNTLKKQITLDLGQGIAGAVAESCEPLLIQDAQTDTRFFSGADAKTGFVTRSLIAVPLIGRKGLIGVAEILNPRSREQFTDYDLEIFQALCRQVAVAMENAVYHRKSLEQERLRHEIELAATIQRSFLPAVPSFRKGRISARAVNVPAKEVGGDLYDFVDLPGGKAGIFIGDISGKGISAALFMAKTVSDFRYAARNETRPDKVMEHLGAAISGAPRGMFLAGLYVVVDCESGECRIASAGSPPFFRIVGDDVVSTEAEAGPPAGILDCEYPVTALSMQPGERLLLFTDGLFDAKDADGGRFGLERSQAAVLQYRHDVDILESIIGHLEAFSAGAERADDLTMVEILFECPPGGGDPVA